MKLAVSGKGGVGKSTLAAALSLLMAREGRRVLAVDADPDANLAVSLGMPEEKQRQIVPVSQQRALIEERTGAKVRQYGQIFRLNPEVSDIADNFAVSYEGVALLVLGAVESGGSGCACPENVLIKALVTDLILNKNEALVMDMEAGIEHLGRATAKAVDVMIVVVEPGRRSVDTAHNVARLAGDIGLKRVSFVLNKITCAADEEFARKSLPDSDIIGAIPFLEELRVADRAGRSVIDSLSKEHLSVFETVLKNISKIEKQ